LAVINSSVFVCSDVMSNFFAALDESGDEAVISKRESKVKKEIVVTQKERAEVEPSKSDRRGQKHDDRNTKTGRGRPPPTRDGKRIYDRRSGTGRGREIKKDGGGGRNWGSDKNEAKRGERRGARVAVDEANNGVKKERESVTTDNYNNENKNDNMAQNESEEPKSKEDVADHHPSEKSDLAVEKQEEPEDNTVSYEDYLKNKQTSASGVLAPVQTKELVNEFAGKSNYVVKKEDQFVLGGGKKLRKKGSQKKDGDKKLTPSFRVGDPARRDGRDRDRKDIRDRGDRRSGRSDRRGEQKKQVEINVADTDAFPTL